MEDGKTGAVPHAGARIQRRKKRMVAFSAPRNRRLHTRHVHVANTGPAVGVAVETIWEAFSAYGLVERVVAEHARRAYVVVTYVDVDGAERAVAARNRPPGAGSVVKDNFMPTPGQPVPLAGRWLRVTFAEQRRPLDEQDSESGVVYYGPPGTADRVAAWRAEHRRGPSASGGGGGDALRELLAIAGGDKDASSGAGQVDAYTVLRATSGVPTAAAAAARNSEGPQQQQQQQQQQIPAPAAQQERVVPARIECPLCLHKFARGRGLRMHLTADATGRGHGLSGHVLAATIAAAEKLALEAGKNGDKATKGTADAAAAAEAKAKAKAKARAGAGAGVVHTEYKEGSGRGGKGKREVSTAVALHPALRAARDGDLLALQRMVEGKECEEGVANVIDKNGGCALHWAAGAGHMQVCKYLVHAAGADARVAVTKGRRDGRTALHWAARNGHGAVCRWLVSDEGVDVNMGTKDGTTALMWAVWQGHVAVARLLVSLGASTDAVNAFGCTVAHWVSLGQSDNVDMAEWLHSLGVDFTRRNAQGHTCLQKAAWKGHLKLCQWLIPRVLDVAEVHRPDNGGFTAMDIARMGGRHGVVSWFMTLHTRA